MKKLIPFFVLLLTGGLFLNSCSMDLDSPTGVMSMKAPPPPPPTPNPAITYVTFGSHKVQGVMTAYWRLMVMNADGTASFSVFDGPDAGFNSTPTIQSPTWSPDGKHICFVNDDGRATIGGNTYAVHSLWTLDVNVTSTTVTGSNAHQIFTKLSSNEDMRRCAWSPTSNEIIVGANTLTSTGAAALKVYAVPSSGGSSTLLYSRDSTLMGYVSWSPDGTQYALDIVPRNFGTTSDPVYIINRATGNIDNTLMANAGYAITAEWSRTGANTFICGGKPFSAPSSETWHVYTLDNSSSALPVFLFDGTIVCWSPDNTKIVYRSNTSSSCAVKVYNFGSGANTTLLTNTTTPNDFMYLNWKR